MTLWFQLRYTQVRKRNRKKKMKKLITAAHKSSRLRKAETKLNGFSPRRVFPPRYRVGVDNKRVGETLSPSSELYHLRLFHFSDLIRLIIKDHRVG